MTAIERITHPLLLLLGGLAAVWCLAAMDARARVAEEPEVALPALLSPGQLQALAGGFGPALADIYWIQAAATSSESLEGPGAETLYGLLDRVTTLDPRFEPAYHFGAVLLSVGGRRPDLSDRLLRRARDRFPDNWSFPFYLGFNAFYHRTDFLDAARHMARAARLPGAPPYLASLAQRFRDQEHDAEAARELVRRLLRATHDPVIRARLQERLRALEART